MGNKIIVEFDKKSLKEMCKEHRKNRVVYPECEHCDYKSNRTLVECYLGFRIDERDGHHIKGEPTHEDLMKCANPNADDDAMYSILVGD